MARLKSSCRIPRIVVASSSLMTNRPDKLDTDMKRPGRFDLKIPFFAPQTTAERVSLKRSRFGMISHYCRIEVPLSPSSSHSMDMQPLSSKRSYSWRRTSWPAMMMAARLKNRPTL